MAAKYSIVRPEHIERSILLVRGHKVMLDRDLSELYGVKTKVLNQAVKRNIERFPTDFMFQLTPKEAESLRSQSVTSKKGRGGRRHRPYVFTEHGAVMLASVLNSDVAIRASIQVVRAFVSLREILSTHKQLARKLNEMEKKYDRKFAVVFEVIRTLMEPAPEKKKPKIGFIKIGPEKKKKKGKKARTKGKKK